MAQNLHHVGAPAYQVEHVPAETVSEGSCNKSEEKRSQACCKQSRQTQAVDPKPSTLNSEGQSPEPSTLSLLLPQSTTHNPAAQKVPKPPQMGG